MPCRSDNRTERGGRSTLANARMAWLLAVLMRQPSFAASRTFVIWNLLGILDLVVALATGALGTILVAGADAGVTTAAMAQMPLVLIPAFFVPVLFALHAAALLQARRLAAA